MSVDPRSWSARDAQADRVVAAADKIRMPHAIVGRRSRCRRPRTASNSVASSICTASCPDSLSLPKGLWPRERILIRGGDHASAGYSTRSDARLGVAVALVRCGATDEEILRIITASPLGVGSWRASEQERTLRRARAIEARQNRACWSSAIVRHVGTGIARRIGRSRRRFLDLTVEITSGPAAGAQLRDDVPLVDTDVRARGLAACASAVTPPPDPTSPTIDWTSLLGRPVQVQLVERRGNDGTWIHLLAVARPYAQPGTCVSPDAANR